MQQSIVFVEPTLYKAACAVVMHYTPLVPRLILDQAHKDHEDIQHAYLAAVNRVAIETSPHATPE